MRLPLEVEENTRQRARSIEIAPHTARESKLLQQFGKTAVQESVPALHEISNFLEVANAKS